MACPNNRFEGLLTTFDRWPRLAWTGFSLYELQLSPAIAPSPDRHGRWQVRMPDPLFSAASRLALACLLWVTADIVQPYTPAQGQRTCISPFPSGRGLPGAGTMPTAVRRLSLSPPRYTPYCQSVTENVPRPARWVAPESSRESLAALEVAILSGCLPVDLFGRRIRPGPSARLVRPVASIFA